MNTLALARRVYHRLKWSAALLALAGGTVGAAEVGVLSGGAVEPGLHAAAAVFEKETGHRLALRFATAPQMRERVLAGETVDVVIAPPEAIDEFVQSGRALGAPRVAVGRVGVGVAVRAGLPLPDISSAEAVWRLMLASESLVFNRASTGLYLEGLLKRQGLYERLQPHITRYPDGASVMSHLVRGQGREVGFGASTEILMLRGQGLQYVGPLPTEIQNHTRYVAVPLAAAREPDAALAWLRFLAGPAARAIFQHHGIDPP